MQKAGLWGALFLFLMACHRSSGDLPPSDLAATPAVIDTLTYRVKGIDFRMLVLSGGRFEMGATAEQPPLFTAEYPPHEVELTPFAIGETEVTQALWLAVMGDTSTVARRWTPEVGKGADYPAYGVSYADAQVFLQRLRAATGQPFRLPTEAEWECAARSGGAGQQTLYSGSNAYDAVGWCAENSGKACHRVQTRQPNAWGLYDLCGNVWEWCADWFSTYRIELLADHIGEVWATRLSGDQPPYIVPIHPTGPATGRYRVLRGGSWNDAASVCRVSFRVGLPPTFYHDSFGLRLALNAH